MQPSRATVPALLCSVALFLLGCVGCCGDFASGFRQGLDQSFDKGFAESYRTSFVDNCVGGASNTDADVMRTMCACTADKLLAEHSSAELMALSADTNDPANQAVITAAVEACMPGSASAQPGSQ